MTDVDGRAAPRENPDLRGHHDAESGLRRAFSSGRLPHAWLISGPRGVGKATLAFRFARFVLARGGAPAGGPLDAAPAAAEHRDLHVDTDHPVFRRVASGGHADLFTVERGFDEKRGRLRTEIVVDDVRAMGGFLRLTPAEGGWRVVIVDSADEMNRSAANAVLKVLEEPSPGALLLLVSHSPGGLLPTIRSRCRHLALKPLLEDDVTALLARYCPGLAATEARVLVGLAEGSIGRALALAAEGGLDLYRELMALLAGLPDLDIVALHAFGDRLARPGAEDAYRTATDLLRWWLGRLILFGARRGAPPIDEVDAEDRDLMERLADAGSLDPWLEVWEKINRLLARAGGANLDRKQIVLNAFLALENAARV